MREVHFFEFVIKLDEEVDDCLGEVEVLQTVQGGCHWPEEVHHLYCRINDYSRMTHSVLFLLHDWHLDRLYHPQNPVLALDSPPFLLDQFGLVLGLRGNGDINCLPSLFDY